MNTRWLAATIIKQVIHNGKSLTAALDEALPSVQSTADKSFIQAICYGSCRYYHRLDFILDQILDKPLKSPEVKALLMVGLYQLAFMRVKPHAAVSETVQASRNVSWAKALINAVLRMYLRNQEELETLANQSKAACQSHPDWMIALLEDCWPDQATQLMKDNNQPAPMTLRLNLSKTTREDYGALLQKQGVEAKSLEFCPSALVLEQPVPVETLPGFTKGWVSVQDAAAQMAAYLLNSQPGQRILDVCAAPGGKTAHILESQPDINLCALDIDADRMRRVRDNLDRLGLEANLIVADAVDVASWHDGKPFDRILLDAPCSATGVIRRHPDIKLLRRADDIPALVAQQAQILRAVWPLLKSGGELLYATCSVLRQENEGQISDFIATHADAVALPIATGDWGLAHENGRQILTGESSMDGFYYARILKR